MSRPDVDVTSLTVGGVLAGVGVSYLVAEAADADVDLAWFAASTLIALGLVAVVLGVLRVVRDRDRPEPAAGARTTAAGDADADAGEDVAAGTSGSTADDEPAPPER